MEEFTFGVITYNQEHLVLDTLNSIKYQIERFGLGINVDLVVADDASVDNTCGVIKSWVDKNRALFRNVEFLFSEDNKGIVANHLHLVKHIYTEQYKGIAGDDVFFDEDVFRVIGNNNFVITPVVAFSKDGMLNIPGRSFICDALFYQKRSRLKEFLVEGLGYCKIPAAPGVFYKHSLVEEGYFQYLSSYKWIEDVPTWNYFYKKKEFKPVALSTPYVLYRCDVGISTNNNHSKGKEFLEELERIKHEIFVYKQAKGWLNLYKCKEKIFHAYNKYIAWSECRDVIEFQQRIPEYYERARKHLELIRSMR